MTLFGGIGVSPELQELRVEPHGNSEANVFTDKVDGDLNEYLAWGKKNLSSSAYSGFISHMRTAAAHLRRSAASINQLNQCPLEIQAQTHEALDILHAAANNFTRQQVPYAKNKAAVVARRGEIDRDIESMSGQLIRLDVQTRSFPSEKVLGGCLVEHPLLKHDQYLQQKKVASKLAKAFADKIEVSEQEFHNELVRVMKEDIKLPSPALAVTLDTALTDCAKK